MRVLRCQDLCIRLGVSRKTLWRLRRTDPTFPLPRQITRGISGWLESDLDAWLQARPVAKGGAES